jgi:ASCH domain
MISSFSWTTQTLLDGKKTVTRHDWPELHAKKFRMGAIVTAYDKQPCWGGRPVARIQIVSVRRESLNELYASPQYARAELNREGDLWRDLDGFRALVYWSLEFLWMPAREGLRS